MVGLIACVGVGLLLWLEGLGAVGVRVAVGNGVGCGVGRNVGVSSGDCEAGFKGTSRGWTVAMG
jgi:hypothetical protein